MDGSKIQEMPFADFAQAITPRWMILASNPSKPPRDKLAWLSTVWDTADCRLTYSIEWDYGPLTQGLPPAARCYKFEDSALYAPTAELALDPNSRDDNRKTAELLAARNAWLSAVRSHCQQCACEGRYESLAANVADDYVLLSCQWTAHPWVRARVRQYLEEQARSQALQPSAPREMSAEPGWPSAQVIHARSEPLSREQQAKQQAERATIGYWINQFKFDDGCWSSEFAMYAWDAQEDIRVANKKIEELQKLLDAQRAHIQYLDRLVQQNKRRDAALTCSPGKAGRPKGSPERQSIARQFTAEWVRSLMNVLEAPSCAQLEKVVSGNQRNWSRWLNGKAVPSGSSLAELSTMKVTQGSYKGRLLKDIVTTPAYDELLTLVDLAGMAVKAD